MSFTDNGFLFVFYKVCYDLISKFTAKYLPNFVFRSKNEMIRTPDELEI